MCGCTFESLAGRREAAVFSLICKLLDKECVEPLQAFCPDFAVKVVSEDGAKTRQRTAAENDNNLKLEAKTGQLRSFSLQTYKHSWQGQAAQIFDKVPSNLKAKGEKDSWLKVKSAGKASLNGSAERKKKSADLVSNKKKKLNNKVQLPWHPGGGVNVRYWIEYAIYWNTNKTLLLSLKNSDRSLIASFRLDYPSVSFDYLSDGAK